MSINNSGFTVITAIRPTVITANITSDGVSPSIVVQAGQEYNVYGYGIFDTATVAVEWSVDGVGDTWVTQVSNAAGQALQGGIFANSLYVVIGNNGTVVTSPDAVTWTARTSNTNEFLQDVAFGAGTFVAVGSNGQVITSPDAITAWSLRLSNVSATLQGVVFSNGLFVVCGNTGTIITSADGITWATQTVPTSASLLSITFGKGLFVAVGADTVITSPDGFVWTAQVSAISTSLTHIIFTGDVFLVTSSAASNNIMTSFDGITWTLAGVGVEGSVLFTAAFAFNTYLVGGGGGGIFTSPDALNWTGQNSGTAVNILDIFEGANILVATGNSAVIQTNAVGWVPLEDGDGTPVSFTAQEVFNIPRIGAGVKMRTNTSSAGATTNVTVDLR